MKVSKKLLFNLWFSATVLGICTGMTYMWYEDYAIMKKCHEACGDRRLIACPAQTWSEATAFCQDSKTTMSVYEVKR